MYNKAIEIHFYDKNTAAVRLVKSSGELPFAESLFYSLYSTRQLVNIAPSKTISSSLAVSLTHTTEALDTLRSAVEYRNVKIIDYLVFSPGKRIFVAELYCDAERANFNVKPKGFGVLARGVDYFAATSVLVLLRHYARTLKEDSDLAVLGKTAELIGHTFLEGGLGISNQSAAAELIWQKVTGEVVPQAENKMDQSLVDERRTTPANDEPTVERSLNEQFWNLDPEAKATFLQPFFLKHCVDGFAKNMTPALLQHVPETSRIFQGEEGEKYLTGELGAMIIDGYFAGRLSMGGLPEVHPITLVPNENRDKLHSQISNLWKSLEIAVAEEALNELLAELVTVRLNMKGFKEVEDHESLGKYLFLMLMNGVQWAKAEKDIIG